MLNEVPIVNPDIECSTNGLEQDREKKKPNNNWAFKNKYLRYFLPKAIEGNHFFLNTKTI